MGGIDGADARCQRLAINVGSQGKFKALLSTSTLNATDRLAILGPVKLADGSVVATNSADFWDGTLQTSIRRTEKNAQKDTTVWTNTNSNGTLDSANSCEDWASVLTSRSSRRGHSYNSDYQAFDAADQDCNSFSAIYCISQQ